MPNKGQSWQWQSVQVVGSDGAAHDAKIIGSCNGDQYFASYFKDDGAGNLIVPDGSVSGTGTVCEEQAVKTWATEQYSSPERH